MLDFDACESVVTTGSGKYLLKPVVNVIPTAIKGISGFVVTSLLDGHVVVSAQQNGKVISSTVPSASGEFFLAHLAPGNYDVAITAVLSVPASRPIQGSAGRSNRDLA